MAETATGKRPAFQFYPADWRKDVELQSCSLAARGLWIDSMCLAHECTPYGHLTINGKPMTAAQLSRQVGATPKETEALLAELEDAGVARRTPEGVLYSKRMVEDEALRNVRAQGGKGGAEHGAKGAEHGSKGGRPRKDKGGFETPLGGTSKPPPSSSSSSSSSPSGISDPDGSLSPDAPTTGGLPGMDPPAEPPPPPAPPPEPPAPAPEKLPPCPQRKVLEMFGQQLPALPQPKAELWLAGKNAEALGARWKWLFTARRKSGERYATTVDEALDWFRRFFDYVGDSDFLMGRNSAQFKCSLSWLVTASNFEKVVTGNYENREG